MLISTISIVSLVSTNLKTITNTTTSNIQITKKASDTFLWYKTFGGIEWEEGDWVEQTSDGGYIIVGYTESYGAGNRDFWLIKTYPNGTEEWNKTFGGTVSDEGHCVKQTSDGGYIITGRTNSFSDGYLDAWLIKTDANGNEDWNKTYGGNKGDWGEHIAQTLDGGYIITGYTWSYGVGERDVWLLKTDENGIEDWNKTYGGIEYDGSSGVMQANDGGYVIVGYTRSFSVGSEDVWLIKTDENGDEIWNKTYGGTNIDYATCVKQTSDEGYIVTGYTGSYGAGGDVWLIKTDENGDYLWNRTYGGSYSDRGNCVVQTSDGGYIITGRTESYSPMYYDICLIKTDEVGSGVPFIDNPTDVVYDESNTGNSITWTATDYNPDKYNITRNSEVVESGSWNSGEPITISVDGLVGGIYLYTCTVNDTAGYWASDTVMVSVTAIGPIINHPNNITYNEGSTGHSITWIATDFNPYNYNIIKDGKLVKSGYWNSGEPITISVDGLSLGTHTYTCIVNDTTGLYTNDNVTVKVIDGTDPIFIDPPEDITYEKGTTGHSITWNTSEINPFSYTITNNSILVKGGSWGGDPLTVNIDGLSVGIYIYNCTVNDINGNQASDSVTVTVIAESEKDSEFLLVIILLILAIIGITIVIGKYKH